MKKFIKTLTKYSDDQRFASLTFWIRDQQDKLRGIWVSGSAFTSGRRSVSIRMVPDDLYPIREVENTSAEGPAKTEYTTEFGPIKAQIYGGRLFVQIPNEVVTKDEFPAQRPILEAVC